MNHSQLLQGKSRRVRAKSFGCFHEIAKLGKPVSSSISGRVLRKIRFVNFNQNLITTLFLFWNNVVRSIQSGLRRVFCFHFSVFNLNNIVREMETYN